MSADNFNYVRKVDGRWRVWLNLSASCELSLQIDREPDNTFDDLTAAVKWADEEGGYVEYGTQIDERNRISRDNQNRAKLGRERAGLSLGQAATLLGITEARLASVEELDPAHADFDFVSSPTCTARASNG